MVEVWIRMLGGGWLVLPRHTLAYAYSDTRAGDDPHQHRSPALGLLVAYRTVGRSLTYRQNMSPALAGHFDRDFKLGAPAPECRGTIRDIVSVE